MDTMTNDQVIAGLDVGSSRVTTVLGRRTQDGVEILGMGECPTDGMRKGAVVNVDATGKSIRQSTTEAGGRTLARCGEQADFDVESFVLSPLASAEAVLTP